MREAALGATARVPGHADNWPGWEDSAVDPCRLGRLPPGPGRLCEEYGYTEASLYGHFGQGCVHTRLPFDLLTAAGVAEFRSFLERAADLVARTGDRSPASMVTGRPAASSWSDVRAEIVEAFREMKAVFDPFGRNEPRQGQRSSPARRPTCGWAPTTTMSGSTPSSATPTTMALRSGRAALRRRRQVPPQGGGVMCPSYMVTREEEHSTRGRARLLFEMLDGPSGAGPWPRGWRSAAVRDALDLCLACKGCKSDCPVNVDMATYKAEFLAHHYARRLRPAAHYSMGWLPVWAELAASAPRTINAVTHARAPRSRCSSDRRDRRAARAAVLRRRRRSAVVRRRGRRRAANGAR